MKTKKQKEDHIFYKELGNRIYMVRSVNGITRGGLGKYLGVSSQQISKYESGENKISIPSLVAVAKYLKTPLTYLISGNSEEEDQSEDVKLSIHAARFFADVKNAKARKAILELMKFLNK